MDQQVSNILMDFVTGDLTFDEAKAKILALMEHYKNETPLQLSSRIGFPPVGHI